jgi:hypothetical protein
MMFPKLLNIQTLSVNSRRICSGTYFKRTNSFRGEINSGIKKLGLKKRHRQNLTRRLLTVVAFRPILLVSRILPGVSGQGLEPLPILKKCFTARGPNRPPRRPMHRRVRLAKPRKNAAYGAPHAAAPSRPHGRGCPETQTLEATARNPDRISRVMAQKLRARKILAQSLERFLWKTRVMAQSPTRFFRAWSNPSNF